MAGILSAHQHGGGKRASRAGKQPNDALRLDDSSLLRQQRRVFKHRLGRLLLLVWRIAVLARDPLDEHT